MTPQQFRQKQKETIIKFYPKEGEKVRLRLGIGRTTFYLLKREMRKEGIELPDLRYRVKS